MGRAPVFDLANYYEATRPNRKAENAARDVRIRTLARIGLSYAVIARRVNLTANRVREIVIGKGVARDCAS